MLEITVNVLSVFGLVRDLNQLKDNTKETLYQQRVSFDVCWLIPVAPWRAPAGTPGTTGPRRFGKWTWPTRFKHNNSRLPAIPAARLLLFQKLQILQRIA